jgi:hypothetical protein
MVGLVSLITKVGVEEGVEGVEERSIARSEVSTRITEVVGQAVARSLAGDDLYQRDIITCTVPEAWLNDEIISPPLHGLVSLITKVGVEEGVEGVEERSIARSEVSTRHAECARTGRRQIISRR